MVKELPAMPAKPQPSAKVYASTFVVFMPAAPAIARFWVTARMRNPQRVLYKSR